MAECCWGICQLSGLRGYKLLQSKKENVTSTRLYLFVGEPASNPREQSTEKDRQDRYIDTSRGQMLFGSHRSMKS